MKQNSIVQELLFGNRIVVGYLREQNMKGGECKT